MGYYHKEPELLPHMVLSVNKGHQNPFNDLEAFILAIQKMIKIQVKQGKRGIVLAKGQANERKISYEELQAILFALSTYFGLKGAFSYGICSNCGNFLNSCSTEGIAGYCNGNEKTCFDSCSKHNGAGGFGKE